MSSSPDSDSEGNPTRTRLPAMSGQAPAAGEGTPTWMSGPGGSSSDLPEPIGRFEIRRFVGEGAFGRVYEAFDPALKRTVALKVAKAEQMAAEGRIERFLREARAAALL